MWDQFEDFDRFAHGVDAVTEDIAGVADDIAAATADVRRATVYTQQEIAQAQRDWQQRRPADPNMPFWQRTWFYASDQEKLFIILGIAGVAIALVPALRSAIK
jgi:hypothetical protein